MNDLKTLCDELSLIAWNAEPKNAQTIVKAIELLKGQPKIVRCLDCVYYRQDGYCEYNNFALYNKNWFCADGTTGEEQDG